MLFSYAILGFAFAEATGLKKVQYKLGELQEGLERKLTCSEA
jgi:hypothetical protein